MTLHATIAPSVHEGLADVAPVDATAVFAVENMHCGGCLRSVEKALSQVPGVNHARANLSARRATIRFDPAICSETALVDALDKAGFKAASIAGQGDGKVQQKDGDYLRRVGVAGFAAANIMLLSVAVWSGAAGDMDSVTQAFFHRLSAFIALPAIAYSGQPFFQSALAALKGRRLNMDVPISLAIILASGMSCFQMLSGSEQVYFDAAITLIFFLLIGRWLDQRLRVRAQGEAQNLLGLQNGLCTRVSTAGRQTEVPAHTLVPGDMVLVATGARVPADGTLVSRIAEIDQSLITGESLPVGISEGEQVYAGSMNLAGPMTLRVTAADDTTLLSEIARLMANAEQGRAAYRRLADRAAAIYAPVVHILGAATFAIWAWLGAGWETSLTHAIAVLIITCPCALALAVPAVQIAAASRLFRQGIILKTADALERLAEVDAVVFDKTGTLTLGRPVLLDADKVSRKVLSDAASLAVSSKHPYAIALVDAARPVVEITASTDGVEEIVGKGLKRTTPHGDERLGSAEWCGVEDSQGASLWYRPANGKSVPFHFRDRLRPEALETTARLRSDGLELSVLSGDRRDAVAEAADALSIDDWRGEMKPQEKISALTELGKYRKVLMVGDGLNDAPCLAAAHASMSPARAADITQRTADFVFQGDSLEPVAEAILVSRRARSLAFQNFAIALTYNAICVPLAMLGYVTPLIAAIAMSTSSILVTANALRLTYGSRESLR